MKIALAMGLEDYYERGIARGIVRYVRERNDWRLYGQAWMLKSHDDLEQWHGDGIIARIETEEAAQRLATLRLPLVDVANAFRREGFRYVANHDEATGRRGGAYLKSLGFSNLAFAGVSGVRWSSEREAGFTAATGEPVATFQRPLRWYKEQEESRELEEFLAALPRPAALFAANDTVALRAAGAARRAGVAVPGDVAILGVDNEDIPCEMSHPSLSSITVALEEIGYQAAGMLQGIIEGRPVPLIRRIAAGEVIERESTGTFAFEDPLVAEAMRLIRNEGVSIRTVTQLTGRLNASRRSLELHFKRETGRTLHEELIRSRIEFACALLKRGNEKVSSVASDAGFASVQRFYAVFKEQTGVTPREYRRSDGFDSLDQE